MLIMYYTKLWSSDDHSCIILVTRIKRNERPEVEVGGGGKDRRHQRARQLFHAVSGLE